MRDNSGFSYKNSTLVGNIACMPRNFRRNDHDIFSRFIFNPTLIRRDCGIAGTRGNS